MKDQSGISDPACAGLVWLALGDVAVPAGSPLVPGFRVLGGLGSGGQGTTWLAARESDGLTVALKVVLADQPDTIELEYAGMRLRNVTWDQGEISGDLVYEDILSEPVCEQMTPARFPGAF